ncbi:hypothetical protein Y032_0006g2793 [Ancylostoma ceylanicum]|uniref:SAM domain-containing protein n=1 Tax=Ancylostoma ceylanicum TaxID=53326 RepID=A0A016VQ12_9BILA|nr:hypothetical protein Y032_0006g2793 [Ancylostoma ceylanicum]
MPYTYSERRYRHVCLPDPRGTRRRRAAHARITAVAANRVFLLFIEKKIAKKHTVGVDGGDPPAEPKNTRRDRAARAGIPSRTPNYGVFLTVVTSNVMNKYRENPDSPLQRRSHSTPPEEKLIMPMNSLFDALPETPKSPDPLDSPIASSILKGAKEYNKKNDLWNKTVAARADRDQMLMKATQAIFDDTALTKSVPRYPTDLWAGYGFSCSLPADLLKGILDISEENEVPEGRPILGRDAKTPPRGLCAVREEDELSEFSGSFSSNSMNSANRVFERKNRSAFSASTSIFDSSPIVSEFTWDIRVFVDPAMVLAQLGCSEYMTQLREQEIDMHAFLLLDEQNLKDIGVSTIGARKKIHHAIIKLRESARMHGYAI